MVITSSTPRSVARYTGEIGRNNASLTVRENEDRVTIRGDVGIVHLDLQQRPGPGYDSILGFLQSSGCNWPVSIYSAPSSPCDPDIRHIGGDVAGQPIDIVHQNDHFEGTIGASSICADLAEGDEGQELTGTVTVPGYGCYELHLAGSGESVPLEGLLPALSLVLDQQPEAAPPDRKSPAP
ncbi:MAG: hypothetical protein KC910_27895 [Candidatus Eremiobacteraeota bacterium]|nr:hypothetical protein [Candidatus Eremiobacteraeota bacterium]